MDILKVLSRGLKQPHGGKNANASTNFLPAGATTLPSAGSSINPQLYHDQVAGGSSNKKRKRDGAATSGAERLEDNDNDDSADDSADDMSELDFFGERSTTTTADATKHAKSESDDGDKKSKTSKTAKKQKRDLASELLDEDACKQILRSHRLKLTLLVDRKAVAEAAKKSKSDKKDKKDKDKEKKSKKAKRAEEEAATAAKDDAKKQLYAQPLTSFSQLRSLYNLSPRLADNLDRLLYRIPTEVQMGSLPLLLDPALALSKATLPGGVATDANSTTATATAVDFMAVAPTGSGKTLSFLVPAINGILKRRAEGKGDGDDDHDDGAKEGRPKHDHVLDTIVVAPTRELAHQIASEGKKLTVGTGVRVVAMSKGMRVQEEEEEEEEEEGEEDDDDDDKPKAGKATVTHADILVTTPLMLLNSLTRRQKSLPTVQSLILDEADVLLDPLFRDQTMGIWTACTHPDLRATFWSATMASNVEELVVDTLAARQKESSSQQKQQQQKRLLIRLVVGLKDTAVPNVTHRLVYTATEQGKLLAMRQLLHPSTSTSVTGSGSAGGASEALRPPFLVFTQTAERATALHDELKYDIPAAAGGADRLGVLHAALADSARSAVVRRFRAGQVWVLITTDVLARGIDFAGVNGVVNYDVPGSAAAYVHRAGRTGRAGRQGGLSVTLYTKEDIPFVKSVANVIAASEKQAAGGKNASGGADGKGIQQWLLDALPEVTKRDKKRLKTRGVESRRSTTTAAAADRNKGKGRQAASSSKTRRDGKETVPNAKARITSKSAWERRRDNNRRDAIASSKQRKQKEGGDEGEWGGLE
ncbi:RNA-dependent ATPase rok1 [Sporothrix curviconia]|uniref:ATP-dependent RNA helicase ROK1 n=1 Tax=Sporothrix curviconia TaxID=1260050 RepID=A0ABP0BHK7_9PEZI